MLSRRVKDDAGRVHENNVLLWCRELKREGSRTNGEALGKKRSRLTERLAEDMDSSMEIAEEDDEDYVSSLTFTLHLLFFQISLAGLCGSDVWVAKK